MAEHLTENDVFGKEPALQRLAQELDGMYPLRNPAPSDDHDTLMYRAGQRSVVEYILAKLEI